MPKVSGRAPHVVKSFPAEHRRQRPRPTGTRRPTPAGRSRRRRDATRRGRSAAGRGGSTRGRAAAPPGRPAAQTREWPGARPGFSARRNSAHATSGVATFRMPNAIVTPSTDASAHRQLHRIAADQLHAIADSPAHPPCRGPRDSIAPAKSMPTTRRAPRAARARRQRHVAGAGAHVEQRFASAERQRSNRHAGASSDRGPPTAPC